jgi:hypothetical protein
MITGMNPKIQRNLTMKNEGISIIESFALTKCIQLGSEHSRFGLSPADGQIALLFQSTLESLN